MSTKTHDELIKDAVRYATSLGYGLVEQHLGTETGADAVFENHTGEKVILEVVTGGDFKKFFEKPRIRSSVLEAGLPSSNWERTQVSKEGALLWGSPEMMGVIVVADRVDNLKKHAIQAGLRGDFFEPPTQKVFGVLAKDFDKLIPVLLVSILGSKASAYAREYSDSSEQPV